jgi:hypothetical protein
VSYTRSLRVYTLFFIFLKNLNITTQIIAQLCLEHVFTKDNFNDIKVDKLYETEKDALIQAAMEELVTTGIVKKVGDKAMWIMTTPPGYQGQELSLSLSTSTWIAETINDFVKANELEADPVSPLSIHEGHISTLLEIIHDLLSEDEDGE